VIRTDAAIAGTGTAEPASNDAPLEEVDPAVSAAIAAELDRQRNTLEMIASENFAPVAVLQAQGSVLTNKYAEGYPGQRYYGGCEHVDVIEQLASDRARALFGAEHANVQPHSGAQANAAAMAAVLEPGDTILGLDLAHGGHLTHGMRLNFSGKLYRVIAYHVDRQTGRIDMNEVRRLAIQHRPALIIAGWSAYPRQLDFGSFREIADEAGSYLMADMAHFAGLVAAGLHPNPVPHADIVTTTTHKTLRAAGRTHPQPIGAGSKDKLRSLSWPARWPSAACHRGQGRGARGGSDPGVRRTPAANPGRGPNPGRAARPG